MKPIYEPKGKAKEYGDLALNIYTGCPHRCYYCFAPSVLRRERELFHSHVEPRPGIVEATRKQLEAEQITGKLIHLCFTCDPYPTGYDTSVTREIISLLKEHGNHVQILTKGDGSRDLDLLDGEDWYGITLDQIGNGRNQFWKARVEALADAYNSGIRTWVSFEPILDDKKFFKELHLVSPIVDKVKIGKLNYYPSDIDWAQFGADAEALCQELGIDHYIKDSLRKEMEKNIVCKKFVVDGIPNGCGECPFTDGGEYNATCIPLKFSGCEKPEIIGSIEEIYYRRHDCPLKEEPDAKE